MKSGKSNPPRTSSLAKRACIVIASTLSCHVPVFAQAVSDVAAPSCAPQPISDDCTIDGSPILHVVPNHPWRPPFGLDRVGTPTRIRVDIPKSSAHNHELILVASAQGKETERFALGGANASALADTVELRSNPDQVEVRVRCPGTTALLCLAAERVSRPEVEMDAIAELEQAINPVDLGAILVPKDWLLLKEGQTASVRVAAVAHLGSHPDARLRISFSNKPIVDVPLPLPLKERVTTRLQLPPLHTKVDRASLRVSLLDGSRTLWRKEIPVMVSKPLPLSRFGALKTKLRYDAPISIRDRATAALTSIDYDTAWRSDLQDVVISLPNGSRFVFWRGTNYVPFWAGQYNTGLTYEWAENHSQPVKHEDGTVDYPEPLFDTELRYGRVSIVASTASRIHVRWTYQSTDIDYNIWGDQTTEDFYFYPDGFGTRVLTLHSTPGANYELSEFIVITPQSAFPFDVLPNQMVKALFLDGRSESIRFPGPDYIKQQDADTAYPSQLSHSKQTSIVYRVFIEKRDPASAIYFHPRSSVIPFRFEPFFDRDEIVTPAYWGSHWPLSRGKWTGGSIDDRIYASPAHNSLMSWGPGNRPPPLSTSEYPSLDTLGRVRTVAVQKWAWLIGKTDEPDEIVLKRAQSFSAPPSLQLDGVHLNSPSYAPERRAIRFVADARTMTIHLTASSSVVNPVFEIEGPYEQLSRVVLNGKALPSDAYAWDGNVLWLNLTIEPPSGKLLLEFVERPAASPAQRLP